MRSTTRASSAFSSVRCCDGLELVVDDQHLGARVGVAALELLELALADVGARIRAAARCWTSSRDRSRRRRCAPAPRSSASSSSASTPCASTASDEPALGLGARADRAVAPSPTVIMPPAVPTPDLAARTLELVDIPSESRARRRRCSSSATSLPGRARSTTTASRSSSGATAARAGRPRRPPRHGAGAGEPAGPDRGRRRARARRERHEGRLAVMLELAAGAGRRPGSTSPLLPARGAAARGEPAARAVREPGVLAEARARGRARADRLHRSTPAAWATSRRGSCFHGESAHSARPWTGVNAIDALVRGLRRSLELEPLDVELDGLVFREVVSAVRDRGRDRRERRSRSRRARELNYRYAPGRTPDEAEARLRELVARRRGSRSSSNSPAAARAGASSRAARRAAAREPCEPERSTPKQAWTPVRRVREPARHRRASTSARARRAYAHRRRRAGRRSRARALLRDAASGSSLGSSSSGRP